MEVHFSIMKFLAFLIFLWTVSKTEAGKNSKNAEEDPIDAVVKDSHRQLVNGTKEVRRIVESGIKDNARTLEIAASLEKAALETRRKIYSNNTFAEDRAADENEKTETDREGEEGEEKEITLDRLHDLLSFQMFGARREYGLLSKMRRWTRKMLELAGKKGINPEINRYYEQRAKTENEAELLFRNYLTKLTSANGILNRLRDLQDTYMQTMGNDFSDFTDWVADGKAARTALKKYQTNVLAGAYREVQKIDYLVKNLQYRDFIEDDDDVNDDYVDGQGNQEQIAQAAARSLFGSSYLSGQSNVIPCAGGIIAQFIKDMWACVMSGGSGNGNGTGSGGTRGKWTFKNKYGQPRPGDGSNKQILLLICSLKPVFDLLVGLISCF